MLQRNNRDGGLFSFQQRLSRLASACEAAAGPTLYDDWHGARPREIDGTGKPLALASEQNPGSYVAGEMTLAPSEYQLRVLVADDSDDNRFLFSVLLKSAGYLIEEVKNGEEAVRQFRQHRHDIILLDMQMPVMDGYTAAHQIRAWEQTQALRPTSIIALTASAANEDINKGLAAGCNTYLSKPIQRPVLLASLRKIIGGVNP